MSLVYQVEPAPQEYDPEYLERQLTNIADALAAAYDLDISFEPTRPRHGMLRFFDSTVYTPGAGATGLYVYVTSAWVGPLT